MGEAPVSAGAEKLTRPMGDEEMETLVGSSGTPVAVKTTGLDAGEVPYVLREVMDTCMPRTHVRCVQLQAGAHNSWSIGYDGFKEGHAVLTVAAADFQPCLCTRQRGQHVGHHGHSYNGTGPCLHCRSAQQQHQLVEAGNCCR